MNGYEVDNLPIVWADDSTRQKIVQAVSELKHIVNEDYRADENLENQLNQLVYSLYGLTAEEIQEVEKIYK